MICMHGNAPRPTQRTIESFGSVTAYLSLCGNLSFEKYHAGSKGCSVRRPVNKAKRRCCAQPSCPYVHKLPFPKQTAHCTSAFTWSYLLNDLLPMQAESQAGMLRSMQPSHRQHAQNDAVQFAPTMPVSSNSDLFLHLATFYAFPPARHVRRQLVMNCGKLLALIRDVRHKATSESCLQKGWSWEGRL
jgi:hypothetical protein